MARDRARIRQEPLIAFGVPVYGGALIPTMGQDWFVDPNADVFVPKKAWGTGKSDDRPFRTLEEALAACHTHDRIFITGNIREEGLIGSNLKFDVHIIGVGSKHHPDQPTSAYHPGSASIRPPASPTTATALLEIRGRGWQFHNIMFDCPVDAAALKLVTNALSGASEYDASHAVIRSCRFLSGFYGVQDDGGIFNITIDDCVFQQFSPTGATAIINTNVGVRLPSFWRIRNCMFPSYYAGSSAGGNECHIDAALAMSVIQDNVFGTVEGTGKYIDLTGGGGNIVTRNLLEGDYDTGDYVAGTGDDWTGNHSANPTSKATVDASGLTIAVPGA